MDLTHHLWWSEAEGPRHSTSTMSIPLRQRLNSRLSLLSLAGASPHNVLPLHSAQTCAVCGQKNIASWRSVNYKLVTYIHTARLGFVSSLLPEGPASSPALPAGVLSLLIARFPLVFWRAWPCASATTLSRTVHYPWSPRQVASGALLDSSRAWSGSVFLRIWGSLAVKLAALVRIRFSRRSSSLASPDTLQNAAGSSFFSCQFEPVD